MDIVGTMVIVTEEGLNLALYVRSLTAYPKRVHEKFENKKKLHHYGYNMPTNFINFAAVLLRYSRVAVSCTQWSHGRIESHVPWVLDSNPSGCSVQLNEATEQKVSDLTADSFATSPLDVNI